MISRIWAGRLNMNDKGCRPCWRPTPSAASSSSSPPISGIRTPTTPTPVPRPCSPSRSLSGIAPSKQESTTYEPSLVCKLLIVGCRLLIPDRLLDRDSGSSKFSGREIHLAGISPAHRNFCNSSASSLCTGNTRARIAAGTDGGLTGVGLLDPHDPISSNVQLIRPT